MVNTGEESWADCGNCHILGPMAEDEDEAARLWNQLPRQLVWSDQVPSEACQCWVGRDKAEIVIEIKSRAGQLMVYQAGDYEEEAEFITLVEFIGRYGVVKFCPIPRPTEPTDNPKQGD